MFTSSKSWPHDRSNFLKRNRVDIVSYTLKWMNLFDFDWMRIKRKSTFKTQCSSCTTINVTYCKLFCSTSVGFCRVFYSFMEAPFNRWTFCGQIDSHSMPEIDCRLICAITFDSTEVCDDRPWIVANTDRYWPAMDTFGLQAIGWWIFG